MFRLKLGLGNKLKFELALPEKSVPLSPRLADD
jgi:hypothetical protein